MFYAWLDCAYITLLIVAVCANSQNFKMLALTVIVGAGIHVPLLPTANPDLFYLQAFLVEVLVILCAYRLKTPASRAIFLLGCFEALMHLTGLYVGPQPGFGPYRAVIPLIELTKLASCIALSRPVMKHLVKKVTG